MSVTLTRYHEHELQHRTSNSKRRTSPTPVQRWMLNVRRSMFDVRHFHKGMIMEVSYRKGKKEDSPRIAELIDIASGGAVNFLFHDLVPNMPPVQFIAQGLATEDPAHSYTKYDCGNLSTAYSGNITRVSIIISLHYGRDARIFAPRTTRTFSAVLCCPY